MQLTELGRIVHQEWINSIKLRSEIHLNEDELVIMPDHIHGIVWIVGADATHPYDYRDRYRRSSLVSRQP